MNQPVHRSKWQRTKTGILVFLDIILVIVSMIAALWIRFDFQFGHIEPVFLDSVVKYIPINVICTLALFAAFRLYSILWQFASIMEVRNVIAAVTLSTLLQFVGMHLLSWETPRSYPFLYLVILLALTAVSRYFYRIIPGLKIKALMGKEEDAQRTIVVGAGKAGNMLINEIIRGDRVSRKIACVVDDDPAKSGTYLHGIPVLGGCDQIPELSRKFGANEIIIAIPSVTLEEKKRLLNICQQTGCKVLTLPGIYQIIDGTVNVSMLREVEINDLLGREPVDLRTESVMGYVKGKTILVTGGGGSIGSEICRQVALHEPKLLIIFDIYENNAYAIQHELWKKHPELNLEVLIGSVRNQNRVEAIFRQYHPDLVFHAAAHKHVPLMEDSPNESIKNNVLGTWLVAQAADRYQAQKMVLISTDKAVRPTNIMGASKRICELIIQSFAQTSKTEFAAVRFGNVLGSNGSVVPLFKKQIAAGGPVTVTHPEVIRYFMTIPEAVNLVLQCGALAKGGEIFILDMGEPVKILDLAKNMIRLSGLEPDKDIKIEFIGLRPGEKLYEELLISMDNLKGTANERIFVAQLAPVDEQWIHDTVCRLIESAFSEAEDIREQVKVLVPEYNPQPNDGEHAEADVLTTAVSN